MDFGKWLGRLKEAADSSQCSCGCEEGGRSGQLAPAVAGAHAGNAVEGSWRRQATRWVQCACRQCGGGRCQHFVHVVRMLVVHALEEGSYASALTGEESGFQLCDECLDAARLERARLAGQRVRVGNRKRSAEEAGTLGRSVRTCERSGEAHVS